MGGTGRRSLAADTLKIPKPITAKTPKATPVLRFQCVGLLHHPPAGDQTYNIININHEQTIIIYKKAKGSVRERPESLLNYLT